MPVASRRILLHTGSGASIDAAAFAATLGAHGYEVVAMDHMPTRLATQHFDAVVFAGGSGAAQARSIGAAGRALVRSFVGQGGGYVGICAGAYMATRAPAAADEAGSADAITATHAVVQSAEAATATATDGASAGTSCLPYALGLLPCSVWQHALWIKHEVLKGNIGVAIPEVAAVSTTTTAGTTSPCPVGTPFCAPASASSASSATTSQAAQQHQQHYRQQHHQQRDVFFANGAMFDPESMGAGVRVIGRITKGIGTAAQRAAMEDKPIIVAGAFGLGKVVLCGAHPEKDARNQGNEDVLCHVLLDNACSPHATTAAAGSMNSNGAWCDCHACAPPSQAAVAEHQRNRQRIKDRMRVLKEEWLAQLDRPFTPELLQEMRTQWLVAATAAEASKQPSQDDATAG